MSNNPDTILYQAIPVLDLTPQIETHWKELTIAIENVLKSGQFIMGPEVTTFEKEAASFLGVKHAVGVNSGTDALIIGLRALGIGKGDEVITTPFTFFATAESISIVGAKPVFVDIDEATFNIDPELIEAAITPKTKAIMPVHLYGKAANMGRIMKIAEKHNLKIIEDCAQSFGATFEGTQTGSIGDIGAYSFFPSKNLGAYGDGGLITTNSDNYAEQMSMLRAHGAKKKYHNEVLGYNSRLDSIQAAILRVKLSYINEWNGKRLEVARTYNELLSVIDDVITPEAPGGHVFHQYTIRITNANRDNVQQKLKNQGINTMVYYPIPQDRLPIYDGQYPANPISDKLTTQVLSLPIWPEISKETQERVVEELARALQ